MSLDSIALSINKPGHGQPLSVSTSQYFLSNCLLHRSASGGILPVNWRDSFCQTWMDSNLFVFCEKAFGRVSNTSKKGERTSAVSSEHYIPNKVFVSPLFHVLRFDCALHQ